MHHTTAEQLILKTKNDYEAIADLFIKKRWYLWPEMERTLTFLRGGDAVLDFGCGFGRLYEAIQKIPDIRYYGVDISQRLIGEAKKIYPSGNFSALSSVTSALPFPGASFAAVYAFAVLHHIPSKEKRKETLLELKRVLAPNGLAVISVWRLDVVHRYRLIIKYTFLRLLGTIDIDLCDVFIPWKDDSGAIRADRYVHLFSVKGLAREVQGAGFIVRQAYIANKGGSIYIIAQKNG